MLLGLFLNARDETIAKERSAAVIVVRHDERMIAGQEATPTKLVIPLRSPEEPWHSLPPRA